MNFRKIYNNEQTKEKIVFSELSFEQFQNFLQNEKDKHLIIKFGANWCGPCKKVEPLLNELFLKMPDNVFCFDIDIDEDLEIFGKLKTKKMIKTIPSIVYYNCKNDRKDKWYLSDLSLSSSKESDVLQFFEKINNNLQ